MRARCRNERDEHFKDYGARGIKVCERWDDFCVFLSDMGERPSPKHSIDRIDNDGNYEPENCRWATTDQQNRNQRRTVRVQLDGQQMCMAEASRRLGLSGTAIRNVASYSGRTIQETVDHYATTRRRAG